MLIQNELASNPYLHTKLDELLLLPRHADLTLSELHLSHNRLRNITREVFGSMHMLQYLDLSHNHIFDMEYDCFKKVKNLQVKIAKITYSSNSYQRYGLS